MRINLKALQSSAFKLILSSGLSAKRWMAKLLLLIILSALDDP